MRRRTAVLLLYLLIFVILSSPCTARKSRRRRRKRSVNSCFHLEDALQKAYFAQVDLIRRGIPTHIIQSEFTWATNYFLTIDSSFRSNRLKGSCVKKWSWNRVFDAPFRSIFALHYLRDIRHLFPRITFLSFEAYPTLPHMSHKEHDLVKSMWETVLVRLEKRPRSKYKVKEFPFPQNIDVLYDPNRNQACEQYNKFRTDYMYKPKQEADAESVLVALILISANLYRGGGNQKAITQMMKHFVGYIFNGIRCLRVEGADIKIPRTLVEAYSRNIGMIRSTATRDTQVFRIKPAAVKHAFKEEIRSLLSYESWGHLQFAVLSEQSSLPMKINVIDKILGKSEFKLLLFHSNMLNSQRSPSGGNPSPKNEKLNVVVTHKKEQIRCDDGYLLMPREEEVSYPLERCCNEICYQWSALITGVLSYSAEDCCSRCNQVNFCDSGITSEDLEDNNVYSFFIPEYGEQDQIDMYLVAL